MKTQATTVRTTRWVLGALLATALASSLAACSPMEEAASFWVHGVIAVSQTDQCVARADARIFRAYGIMDAWMTNRYDMSMQFENFLLSTRAKFGELYGENHIIQIMGAHVAFDYPDGLDKFTADALSTSRFVPGAGEAEPDQGLGVASIQAIQVDLGNALATDSKVRTGGVSLRMKVRLEGRLGDGTIVQSNEYQYPFNVCFGCLYMVTVSDCTDFSDANDMRTPCQIGQDEGLDCRLATLLGLDASEIGR